MFPRWVITMSGTQESGAYLGGIGVMLEVSDVCLACGQVHDGRRFGLKHRRLRECPRVVTGSFPLVSLPSLPEDIALTVPTASETSGRRARATESPKREALVTGDPVPTPRAAPEGARGRALGLPWLPPPDLGEVF